MIIELGVGLLAVNTASYAIRRHRERMKLARIREEQLRKLKQLKRKFEKGE